MGKMHLVIDGYNLIHRAKSGFVTGEWPVVFNFVRGLRPLIEKFNPLSSVYVVLEGHPKRQVALLPEYKGNRRKQTDDFFRQKERIIQLLKLLPITLVSHSDYEADDVIHNMVTRLTADGVSRVTIISSDSDFIQCTQRDLRTPAYSSECVAVWNWLKKSFVERPDFDYLMWKSLRGDPTDNIPKCPGVSDAYASVLVKDKTQLDEFLTEPKNMTRYMLNRQLIELKDISDDEWNSLLITKGVSDWQKIYSLFEEMKFQSILKPSTWEKWKSTFEMIKP